MQRICIGFILACMGLLPLQASAESQKLPWVQVKNISGTTKDAVNVIKQSGTSYLNSKLSQWFSRTDINYSITENNKPIASIETIQPLYMTDFKTIFWQGRIAYTDTHTNANIGLGYRYLTMNERCLWGINTFFDKDLKFLHQRIGLGGELFTQFVTFRANYYQALSGKKLVSSTTYERALSGADASIETPVPYISWMRFVAEGYHWNGSAGPNVDGGKLSLRIFATRQLELDTGVAYDDALHRQGFLKASLYLDKPAFIENAATMTKTKNTFMPQNLENMRLQKVIRQNDIVVEKTSTLSSSDITIARGT